MNPDKQPKPAARNDGGSPDAGDAGATTPGTDMQPDDAGTAASGNDGRGSPAGNAMKQTSKTPSERGDR
jgi:hypothetical protein